MCYFVEINLPRQKLSERFGVKMIDDSRYMPANFLSAFSLPYLPVITALHKDLMQVFRWGLIPSWVKDEMSAKKIVSGTFNARYETVWEKPAFRNGIRYGRCLVPAHGFFEYQTVGKEKVPYYIRLMNDNIFAFAGISENWTNRQTGEIVNTVSIVTRNADEFMERIHNTKKRMPVILNCDTENEWINDNLSKNELVTLMEMPAPPLQAHQIDKKLITGKIDPHNPEIIKPLRPGNKDLF